MPYALYLVKKHLALTAILLTLTAWAVIASTLALQNKRELVLIGLDPNGTRVITSREDPLFKTEVVNFLRSFVSELYTFTPDTFDSSVGRASDLMTTDLWEKEKEKVIKLQAIVKAEAISSSAEITSITKVSTGVFKVGLLMSESRRVGKQTKKLELSVGLRKGERSESNPYGIEVEKLEETLVQ